MRVSLDFNTHRAHPEISRFRRERDEKSVFIADEKTEGI